MSRQSKIAGPYRKMSSKANDFLILFIITVILSLSGYSNVYSEDKTNLVDLRFKDANLIDVIKILAEKGGHNIVVGPDVSGKVTFDLHDVTVQDALEAALKINGYGLERKGKIIFIRSASQLEAKEASSQPPLPLQLRTYKVNYSDVSEIALALKENISKYGKITVNKSNNIIIVEDIEEYLNKIENLVTKLDGIPKQVLIEAKILEIRLRNDTQRGVDWEQVFKGGDASFSLQGANFSLPASVGTPGLFFSVVTPHFEMFLDALQEKGDLKTLATPKLVALDNKEAQIIIGGRLGYKVTTTINQVTTESIEFLDTGTMLKITPHISDDGNIFLSLYPKVSDGVVSSGGIPSETTTEVTTKVVVKDGESIFIGGLIRDRNEKSSRQIPILGEIPIIGSLFKRKTDNVSKTETIIVIAPHIVDSKIIEMNQREKEKIDSFERNKMQ